LTSNDKSPNDRSDNSPPIRSDRSPWNWLLLVPIVIPLITALYNSDEPRLFDFPLFYWLQIAFIVIGVSTTTLVYQMTKKRGDR
jgi:Protein of unknown function (DUF3311).